MADADYQQKLKDPRWQSLARVIRVRDGRRCVICGYTDQVEVHHWVYVRGWEPWEYPDHLLATLCWNCHSEIHELGYVPAIPIRPGGDRPTICLPSRWATGSLTPDEEARLDHYEP